MAINEVNSKYIFTDGEIISFLVDYQVPDGKGMTTDAIIKIKAKHALPNDKFEVSRLELAFSSVVFLKISEIFTRENKISNMTLTKTDDGNFYISLRPYDNSNIPNDSDDFVIKARNFSFDLLKN